MAVIDALSRDGLLSSFGDLVASAQALRIIFADENGQHAHVAELGEATPRSVTQQAPLLQLADGSSPAGSYTIICSDPDLFKKDDQISGDVRHWLTTGAHIVDGWVQVDTKHDVSKYIGPAPGPGTGKHRYVFILARETKAPVEPTRFSDTTSEDLKTRMKFDTPAFTLTNLKLAVESVGKKLVGK